MKHSPTFFCFGVLLAVVLLVTSTEAKSFGNGGSVKAVSENPTTSTTKEDCTPNGLWCWFHDDCCSGYCSRFGSVQTCINPPSNKAIKAEGGRVSEEPTTSTTTTESCTPNGLWCWTHSECCSGYCSRFGSVQTCINPPFKRSS